MQESKLLGSQQHSKFYLKLDAAGILVLSVERETSAAESAGVGAVDKDLEVDRFILIRCPRNSIEFHIEGFSRFLPHGTQLRDVDLSPPTEDSECPVALMSLDDVRDFYYNFSVTLARALSNSMQGVFRFEGFAGTSAAAALEERVGKVDAGAPVVGCLGAMAQGDHEAVEIAQEAHVGLAWEVGALKEDTLMLYCAPPPRGPYLGGIIIDAHLGLWVVFVSKLAALRKNWKPPGPDKKAFTALGANYVRNHLAAHEGKALRRVTHGIFWGSEMEGADGWVCAPRVKTLGLVWVSIGFVRFGGAPGALLSSAVGSWVHVYTYRRALFSILNKLFPLVREADQNPSEWYDFPQEHSDEILLSCCLAPFAVTNQRAAPLSYLPCLDASLFGAGARKAFLNRRVMRELWRHIERRGIWVPVKSRAEAALDELAQRRGKETTEELEIEAPPEDEDGVTSPDAVFRPLWGKRNWAIELVHCLEWEPLFAYLFKRRASIDCQEGKVVVTLTKKLGVEEPDSKVPMIEDSRVTIGGASRGRSGSDTINDQWRISTPYQIGGGLYLGGYHVPSKHCVADADSRRLPFVWPVEEKPVWLTELEQGRYGAFDDEILATDFISVFANWVRFVLRANRYPRVPLLNSLRGPDAAPRPPLQLHDFAPLTSEVKTGASGAVSAPPAKPGESRVSSSKFQQTLERLFKARLIEVSSFVSLWRVSRAVSQSAGMPEDFPDFRALPSLPPATRRALFQDWTDRFEGTPDSIIVFRLRGGLFGFWGPSRLPKEVLARKSSRDDILAALHDVALKVRDSGGSLLLEHRNQREVVGSRLYYLVSLHPSCGPCAVRGLPSSFRSVLVLGFCASWLQVPSLTFDRVVSLLRHGETGEKPEPLRATAEGAGGRSC